MTDALNIGFLQRFLKVKESRAEKEAKEEIERLKEARLKVRQELEISMNNYNHVTEDGLMDFYIYKIRAQQVLEQYLICEIRKKEKEHSA